MATHRKQLVDSRPEPFNPIIDSLGLRVVYHLVGSSIECNDGKRYTFPKHLIGEDGKTLVLWCTGGDYSFGGWEPWHDGMNGGRYSGINEALNWVRVAKGVRAGTIADFRGA